ncbi:MAG: hypothetical protein AB1489_39075, partial [Acidobacteriota bacterium]
MEISLIITLLLDKNVPTPMSSAASSAKSSATPNATPTVKPLDITTAINQLIASDDPALRQDGYTLRECFHVGEEWLVVDNPDVVNANVNAGITVADLPDDASFDIDVDGHDLLLDLTDNSPTEPLPPIYPGLTLKNASTATRHGYFLYVGSREDVLAAADGNPLAFPRANGTKGTKAPWKLLVKFTPHQRGMSARAIARQSIINHISALAMGAGLNAQELADRLRKGFGISTIDELRPEEIRHVISDLRWLAQQKHMEGG